MERNVTVKLKIKDVSDHKDFPFEDDDVKELLDDLVYHTNARLENEAVEIELTSFDIDD